ncbi:MAG: FGGY family carbohydrate kinase [Propionibacteriaceae bacterium]|nr:FGGY family carbohydrate kinase [Propionibacteriaceae bacterium]
MLVAGIDTSTQSCKVLIVDAATGAVIRQGKAAHPDGTEVHPDAWWAAYQEAAAAAGGIADVAAVAVGGQQHGMVCLDAGGEIVRPALLWNDTRSAEAADALILQAGDGDQATGARAWANACGSVLVASITVTKLRWLRDSEPENAARVAAVCLPHDWLSWRLAGHGPKSQGGDGDIGALLTDRSDASGTGYWCPATGAYRPDLLKWALGRDDVALPRVLGPHESAARTPAGAPIGPGAGDNAAAALGLGLTNGDVSVSLGTSGVVSAICPTPVADPSGLVNGFADATGAFLPLACTLNASRIIDAATHLLGVDYDAVSSLALSAQPGADGVTLVPYFEGERTPNKPHATASIHGLTLANTGPANLARAFVEALLCCQADGLDAMVALGVVPERIFLIGGGAKSPAVRRLAPGVFDGHDVIVPPDGEYVARGAARQAAWVVSGADEPPTWPIDGAKTYQGQAEPIVRAQYAAVRELTHPNH